MVALPHVLAPGFTFRFPEDPGPPLLGSLDTGLEGVASTLGAGWSSPQPGAETPAGNKQDTRNPKATSRFGPDLIAPPR
jgi:hypothetical protein